jgi:superfamily II DNA or RNA helicase
LSRPLRAHQHLLSRIVEAIAARETDLRDILAAVTPGGGKSLLPVIAAARLIAAGVVDRICWIVPRDSLRLQAEEAFVDPLWRAALGHALSVRAADNAPDPSRGLAGYITTYQAVAAAPDLHLAEFQQHRYLIVIDELHHLPALSDPDDPAAPAPLSEEAAWSRAILPLIETAEVRLLMSGTLQRADGRAILCLPYVRRRGSRTIRDIDLGCARLAVIGYSRRQAIAERAILPVTFGALDGEAEWLDALEEKQSVPALSEAGMWAHDALFTALRTGFAEALLRTAFSDCRRHRAARRRALGVSLEEEARGLGKLLIVAPDQATARHYGVIVRRWVPNGAFQQVQLAMSDVADAPEAIAAFRLRPSPAVLCTVAMAYEGLDAPEITHVACLTHIRSRPWLEQMIARATRVDPHGGDYAQQRAVVYHPDDPAFRVFRRAIETEQGTRAHLPKGRRQAELAFPRDSQGDTPGITPLRSNATALRFETLAPGPDFAIRPEATGLSRAGDNAASPGPPSPGPPSPGPPSPGPPSPGPLFQRLAAAEPPSRCEHRLRQQICQLVAAQVIEDRDAHLGRTSDYHAYNAILKRVMGKSRAAMSLAELEATLGWLERNRLSDHLGHLEGDAQYRWSRTRRTGRRVGSFRL